MESVYIITIRGWDNLGPWDIIHDVFQSKDAAITEVVKLVANLTSSWWKKEDRELELDLCAEDLKSIGVYNYLIDEKDNWRKFEIVCRNVK